MKFREGPSDALLDEIIGSGHIARQTSRIPPKVRQVGFDIPVQSGGRGSGLFIEGGFATGDRGYPSSPGLAFLRCSSLRAPETDLA